MRVSDILEEALSEELNTTNDKLNSLKGPMVKAAQSEYDQCDESYEIAGKTVSGLRVTDNVPNMESIAASLDDYEILEGIYEIPLSEFDLSGRSYSVNENKRIRFLAAEIDSNGWIDPLIVVEDAEGLYILEGGHRGEALFLLNKPTLPALVVLDNGE